MKTKDWLILIIPVVVLALIMLLPSIPKEIPMQFNTKGEVSWTLPKQIFPIIGILPFIIYIRYKKKDK